MKLLEFLLITQCILFINQTQSQTIDQYQDFDPGPARLFVIGPTDSVISTISIPDINFAQPDTTAAWLVIIHNYKTKLAFEKSASLFQKQANHYLFDLTYQNETANAVTTNKMLIKQGIDELIQTAVDSVLFLSSAYVYQIPLYLPSSRNNFKNLIVKTVRPSLYSVLRRKNLTIEQE